MAVIAYASGDALPLINPDVDPLIDLSAVALPQTVDIYGAAVDTVAPLGPFGYAWAIVADANTGGAPMTLDLPAVAQDNNVTANDWGNCRLFLVVTNTATGESSEINPLLAPDSAFVTVRVLSANEGIQKPAPGERNYFDHMYDWADAIEAGGGVGAHDIASHSDVVTATGAKLELLVDGSYAEDPAGTDMHTHRGAAIDTATEVTTGVVTLEDAGSGACIQRERHQFCASPAGSMLSIGFWPGVIVPKGYDGDAGENFSPYCAVWYAREALVLTDIFIALADGGDDTAGASEAYTFVLYGGTMAQYLANNMGAAMASTVTLAPPAFAYGASADSLSGSWSVPAGNLFAIACTKAPLQSDGFNPGAGLSINVQGYRQV